MRNDTYSNVLVIISLLLYRIYYIYLFPSIILADYYAESRDCRRQLDRISNIVKRTLENLLCFEFYFDNFYCLSDRSCLRSQKFWPVMSSRTPCLDYAKGIVHHQFSLTDR